MGGNTSAGVQRVRMGSARGGAGNWEGPRDCERGSGLTCDWNVADGVVVSVPVAGSSFVKVGKILKRRK